MDSMPDYHTNTLRGALRRLTRNRFPPAAVPYLTAKSNAINSELYDTVLRQIPAFSESGNPDVLSGLAQHGPEHTAEILRLLAGGSIGGFEFVREHARRRAEQRFPLEATLHAYRCGHKVFSRWVREAALAAVSSPEDAQRAIAAVADFTIEYTDAISTIAARDYLAQTRLLADVAGDQRAELLSILLDGHDESDVRVAQVLRNAGYLGRRLSFCVALAWSVDPGEMLNSGRARRLADSIERILHASPARRVVDVRNNKVTIIFSETRRGSGWTKQRTGLAKRVSSELSKVGNAALIGVSNDVPSTSQIPTAYREALLALEFADVSRRVVQFAEIPLRHLILHLAGDELQRVLPAWTGEFVLADHASGGALVATLRAYADANMNVLKTAKMLSVHPNTVYSRFQKILHITGLDAKSYEALTGMLVVADCKRRSSSAA